MIINNKKSTSAIIAFFSSTETFQNYMKNSQNKNTLDSFINFSMREGIINKCNKSTFAAFVKNKTKNNILTKAPESLNFEQLLHNKRKLLKINLSKRALTDRINNLIEKNRSRYLK